MAYANLAAMTDADTARLTDTMTKVRNGIPVSQEAFVEWFESPLGYFRPYNGETQQSIASGISTQNEQAMAGDKSGFAEFLEVPAIFASLATGAQGLSGLLSGAGAGAGTAADWWSGMPSGTTEASFGGLGGEVAGADSLVNLASDVGGLDDAITVDYSGMSNVDNFGGGNYAPTGNEADWWTTVPQGTAEAAAGGIGSAASPSLWSQVTGFMKENPWVAPFVGNIGAAGIGLLGTSKATSAIKDATQGSNDLQKYIHDTTRADFAPWRTAGAAAVGRMSDLTTPGKQLDTAMLDPGYAFRQSEGEKGINRAAAARGLWDSGRTYKALDRFNQDYATQEFGNVFNRNAAIAGLGQTATGNTASAGSEYGRSAGANTLAGGAARASGYMGGANTLAELIARMSNNYNPYFKG